MSQACNGRLDRTHHCTLPKDHEHRAGGPWNHEEWEDGELVAEWEDKSYGAWREGNR